MLFLWKSRALFSFLETFPPTTAMWQNHPRLLTISAIKTTAKSLFICCIFIITQNKDVSHLPRISIKMALNEPSFGWKSNSLLCGNYKQKFNDLIQASHMVSTLKEHSYTKNMSVLGSTKVTRNCPDWDDIYKVPFLFYQKKHSYMSKAPFLTIIVDGTHLNFQNLFKLILNPLGSMSDADKLKIQNPISNIDFW